MLQLAIKFNTATQFRYRYHTAAVLQL